MNSSFFAVHLLLRNKDIEERLWVSEESYRCRSNVVEGRSLKLNDCDARKPLAEIMLLSLWNLLERILTSLEAKDLLCLGSLPNGIIKTKCLLNSRISVKWVLGCPNLLIILHS